MIISITGTPGTGKTQAAKELAKLLGYDVVSIADLVKNKKIPSAYDRKRRTRILDEEKLDKNIRKLLDENKSYIIEGLVAHFVRADFIFVLRTEPAVLEKRLEKKGWSREKIRENVEAETVGEVAADAAGKKNAFEIDTTRRNVSQTAALIKKILNNHRLQKAYGTGKIDWAEKYAAWVKK